MKNTLLQALALALLLLTTPALAQDTARVPTPDARFLHLQVPDVPLVDQHGQQVRLWSDLVRGQTVAINFIFTRCKTICSPMTATLSRVSKELGPDSPVRFISITLDVANDTPERLAQFAAPFAPGPRWSFLTGEPARVKEALVALGGYTSDKEAHRPFVLVGNATADKWLRVEGLGSASAILEGIREVRAASAPPPELDPASARYFTNTELVDQHGKTHRFYEDLIRGRKVLINFAFTSCQGICSPMTRHLAEVQKKLGGRVGKDITMITLSVDPANDTPETLARFAKKFDVGPGWYFLTGAPENVSLVLKKLGGYTDEPGTHSSTLLIGDAATGMWVKAAAMSDVDHLVYTVEHLDDPR
ncbi:Cytochrome oxidase biogenesis protein Sco1/SenC/PrrC, putative copper metallochaperone [Cystobacter fuscus DSM 2262]|uniref:Cytochrome oxidase biogenesis protein Sco1/SenC/PrrC, putative copper metallochaperone n=1 Tax=Cystobacter fuscus (strain ATCC 25194 / DSM 2262 / NBRC 100088 / M29) TaxID=1242864 RepID=S9NTA5_CYSF2|nr:SCO family protein [Cystobacter fuscus]EPX55360.1 Cytochrome oxidase biogenesis protein Sco1/SenC/PrrC, putative copper metallochaperone [Cystobacter fuscus DSM 2262]